MREILFRGKAKETGEWVEGYYAVKGKAYSQPEQHCICVSTLSSSCESVYFTDVEILPETVGQYTGLTDKNGKKVFEGDIIQSKAKGIKGEKIYSFVIKYGKYLPLEYCRAIYSQWQTIGFYAFDGKRDYQLSCFEDLLEVIGNIHDNKEIVKGGAE